MHDPILEGLFRRLADDDTLRPLIADRLDELGLSERAWYVRTDANAALSMGYGKPGQTHPKLLDPSLNFEEVTWDRGIITAVSGPLKGLLDHLPALGVELLGVRTVRVTDREPAVVYFRDIPHWRFWQGHALDGDRYPFRIPWESYLVLRDVTGWHSEQKLRTGVDACANLIYTSEAAAHAALSHAVLSLSLERAGLAAPAPVPA